MFLLNRALGLWLGDVLEDDMLQNVQTGTVNHRLFLKMDSTSPFLLTVQR